MARFNRPGVAGAALQTPLTFIHTLIDSVTDPFPPNLQAIITPKPLELGSCIFFRECSHHVFCVMCDV